MLILPSGITVELARESRRTTVCGVVYKRDGTSVRCTQFDEDLEIETGELAGIYWSGIPITASDVKSAADLSVDNLEVQGTVNDALNFAGFTVADIQAGLFNGAAFETFLVSWADPNGGQKTIRRGYLGEISHTAEGQFTAEWRGLLQPMQQTIGRTYAELCDVVRFCDSRCGILEEDVQQDTVVSSAAGGRQFIAPATAPSDRYFELGEARFLSGRNAGFIGQIKLAAVSAPSIEFELWESLPFDPAPGDEVRLIPGCDRRFSTCQSWTHVGPYGNYKNFRGDGFWIPGIPKIQRAPG